MRVGVGRKSIFVVAAIVLIIGAATGGAVYQQWIAPFRTAVLIVDDSSVRMDYFLKRIQMMGQEPLVVLRALAFEEIVRQVAPDPPFNIRLSKDDIDRHLRAMAAGRGGSIDDAEFSEWYRQQLNESRLTDDEFRKLAQVRLVSLRVKDYLADRVPTVAEQVHLHAITQRTVDDAMGVKARLSAGEDFARLARDMNSDESLKASGGDLGWYPRSALTPELASLAFERLRIGDYSDPVKFGDGQFAVFKVSEKAAAREIDADALAALREDVLENWFNAEFEHHKVTFRGFQNGYDSDTDAWVRQQLKAMEQKSSGSP